MYKIVMIGWCEWVGMFEFEDVFLLVKMDIGVWSNILYVSDIEIIELDFENCVRFCFEDGGEWIERLVSDWRCVCDIGGYEIMCLVIRTILEIVGMDFDIEVCLKDCLLMCHRFIIGC